MDSTTSVVISSFTTTTAECSTSDIVLSYSITPVGAANGAALFSVSASNLTYNWAALSSLNIGTYTIDVTGTIRTWSSSLSFSVEIMNCANSTE